MAAPPGWLDAGAIGRATYDPFVTVREIAEDLVAEQRALDAVVSELSDDQWALDTASPRWTVADQIGHLAFFDDAAALAITDPDVFSARKHALLGLIGEPDEALDEHTLGTYRAMNPTELLAAWRAARDTLSAAAGTLEDGDRVEWFGPSMGAKSFLTARLMECWAHGQDIVDATRRQWEPSNRLRHIAQLGFITRAWSYVNRGLEPPDGSVALALTAPDGSVWSWGPAEADDTISGPALDFCLVVTQRRHRADTALEAGPLGEDWLEKAQAFAGGPTDGPSPAAT